MEAVQELLSSACLCMLLAIAAFGVFAVLARAGKRFSLREKLIVLPFLVLAWYVGATKGPTGRVRVDDPYIEDGGSYLTNDVCHVAIKKKVLILPDATEILVYARELSSTNSADWFRLEPHLTLADHPHDYSLQNATNYNVMVAASYTPPPVVHTNGVWVIKGFVIPGDGKIAFPGTLIDTKE